MTEPLRPLPPPDGTSAADFAEENVRWLIGWMPEPEALQALSAGRYGPGPFPIDLQQRSAAAKAAVAARPPHGVLSAILPHAEGDPVLQALAARPAIQAAFAGQVWEPRYVDLTRVISLQKLVVTDGLTARVSTATTSTEALQELCLPESTQLPDVSCIPDMAGKAITLSSTNPNWRLQGLGLQSDYTVVFSFGLGSPYLNVVQLNGRCFLRDGTHRAVGLLRRGVSEVPAVVITGQSIADIAFSVDLFAPEITMGERPPLLADFLDEEVSAAATRQPLRKVTRIKVDEFFVPR